MAVRLAAEKRESLMGSLIVLTTLRRRNPVLRPQCWIRDDFNLNIDRWDEDAKSAKTITF